MTTPPTPRDCHHGKLARACDECEHEADMAALRAENERLRAFAEKRGHDERCDVQSCKQCMALRQSQGFVDELWFWKEHIHEHQPGPCTCGLSDVMGRR